MFLKRKYEHKSKSIFDSFKYAFNGIIECLLSERNMLVHFIVMFLVVVLGIYYKIDKYEWITCIILFCLVIASELINTAVEASIDLSTPQIDDNARIGKDTAAGAVLVISLGAFIVGLIIFIPKIF